MVGACRQCNEGFSRDEPYVASVIEWAATGCTSIDGVERIKIRRILSHTAALAAQMQEAQRGEPGTIAFDPERVGRVLLKLARGHAAFELNEPQFDPPTEVVYRPLATLDPSKRDAFETPPASTLWPEVGSRAMMRAVDIARGAAGWLTVQPERYRYLAAVLPGAIVVRLVLREYLAAEVIWEN